MSESARQTAALRSILIEMVRSSPYRLAASFLLMIVLTLTEGSSLLLLPPLLELVGVVEESPLPQSGGWLEDGLAAVGLPTTLGTVLLLFVVLATLRASARLGEARLVAAVREDLVAEYRRRVYRALSGAQWRFLVTRTASEFAVTLTSEVGRIGVAVTLLTEMAVGIMVSAIYLGLAVRLSATMAALVVGSAALLGWSVRRSFTRASGMGVRGAEARGRLHAAVAEHVSSIKTARTSGALERHAQDFDQLADESRRVSREVSAGETDLQQHLELGSVILLAVIVYVSSVVLTVSPAVLLVLMFVFARLMPRLVNLYRLWQSLRMVLPVIAGVQQLERECLAAQEPTVALARDITFAHRISFEGVTFSYMHREHHEAVSRLTLSIDAGKTTAIVGASGAGKTTVADLLAGLLTPGSGRILVDGVELTADALSSWRRQMSYVAQDTFLLNDTVRANLLWGGLVAGDAELWGALEQAAATFVRDLPGGLDAVLGERGVQLSGGERQRVAIARALLRQPRVLILDEATSSLDRVNERRIQQAIEGLQHRITIVVIAHRLPTIRHADQIHVMDGGRLARSGTWDTLVREGILPGEPEHELA